MFFGISDITNHWQGVEVVEVSGSQVLSNLRDYHIVAAEEEWNGDDVLLPHQDDYVKEDLEMQGCLVEHFLYSYYSGNWSCWKNL